MSNPLLKYCIIVIASVLVMFGHISFSPVNGITNESCLIESKSSVTTSDNTKDNSASKVLDGNSVLVGLLLQKMLGSKLTWAKI